MARATRAGTGSLEQEWRHLARGLDREHQHGLDDVLKRAERLKHAGADAAFLALLVDYELEIQRLLARVAWLEQDVRPRYTARYAAYPEQPLPAGWRHASEDPVEGDPDEERDLVIGTA